MLRGWLCMGVMLIVLQGFGQQENELDFLHNSAQDFIGFEDFESAREIYHLLDSLKPNQPEYLFYLGVTTFHAQDKPSSLLYFLKALRAGSVQPKLYYYLGLAYQFNYDLDNASYYLNKYRDALDQKARTYEVQLSEVNQLLSQVEQSKKMLDKRLSIDVENMGPLVNSSKADYVPISLRNDSILVYTSRRHGSTGGKVAHDGHHYEDIYQVVRKDSGWSEPRLMPDFNSKHHDANVALSEDEQTMYIYKVKHKGDIYVSYHRGNHRWTKPKPVPGINTLKYWEGSIALSPTEDTIYFSSDRPGGYGGSDLYFAIRDAKGSWINVTNLGPTINTEQDEDSPYLYKDGRTLFFSSRGHTSIGGYDVFSVRLDSTRTWRDVRNLGFPINTVDDDIYFHLNSKASIGYFTSFRHSNFREKSIGEKDIFQIKRPYSSPVYFIFKGRVYDPDSREPLPAIVHLKDKHGKLPDQSLVVDINSGKFRYDLKFDNRYELTVEIGDKLYHSQELYFPHQADMFETFLDIPLKDIPRFTVKLSEVLSEPVDQPREIPLDETKTSTVVLIRKVPFDDPDLKALLASKKIPVSFRKRLLQQLDGTPYLDDPEEGNPIENWDDDMPEMPVLMTRLDGEEKTDIARMDIKSSLQQGNQPSPDWRDTTRLAALSETDRKIIDRLSDFVMSSDTSYQLKTVDELYYENLTQEELTRLNQLVAVNILKEYAKDSSRTEVVENLYRMIDYARTRIQANKPDIKLFNKAAWGILYTAEAGGFRQRTSSHYTLKGTVRHRATGSTVSNLKLLLTDDRGMVYTQTFTDSSGQVSFPDLSAGRRYHILVDDYAIFVLGQSRYQFTEWSMLASDEDYLSFYLNLSPEEKRSVDRIIARQLIDEHYANNPVQRYADDEAFDRLPQSEKDFISRVRKYLTAARMDESDFFMKRADAYRYEQTTIGSRDDLNRMVSRNIQPYQRDSAFYNKLSDVEKGFISRIKDNRKSRHLILEDIMISGEDADYWYILDELSTRHPQERVNVHARVAHKKKVVTGKLQVALMDEMNQIVMVTETDEHGAFSLISVQANKRYKVLINTGGNIDNVYDYELRDVVLEAGDEDFYSQLSDREKRIIDRIIGVNLANESYRTNASMLNDDKSFAQLSPEEQQLINRLRKHLFADTVTADNAHLQRQDNHAYYFGLARSERDFLNRYIVRANYDTVKSGPFPLRDRDRRFYESLTDRQKQFVHHLQRQRKATSDLFAENPVLLADKAWHLLDSINAMAVGGMRMDIVGQVVNRETGAVAPDVPVMLSSATHEALGIVTSDSNGNFSFKNVTERELLYLLAEGKRSLISQKSDLMLSGLRLIVHPDSTGKPQEVWASLPADTLIVYFNFDSDKLTQATQQKLREWLSSLRGTRVVVVIEGHTDAVGSDHYNMQLSRKRSLAVSEFVLKAGQSIEVKLRHYGERKPRYNGKRSALNRRVELH
jgi:flagellar motor protein MotB